MPTAKPRVSITFPPELYDVLKQTAALRGVSFSAQVLEYLECARPVMERTFTVLEALEAKRAAAEAGTDEEWRKFQQSLEEAEKVLAPLLVAALHDLQPPPSNTGVTSPTVQSPLTPANVTKAPSRAASSKGKRS